MDPQMSARMLVQKEARLSQLKAEMAWELERHRVAHHKLRARYLDPIEGMRFVVKAFLSSHQIASLRFPKASKEFMSHAQGVVLAASRAVSWAKKSKESVIKTRLSTAASQSSTV